MPTCKACGRDREPGKRCRPCQSRKTQAYRHGRIASDAGWLEASREYHRRWRKAHPGAYARYHRKNRYGISDESFRAKVLEQGGRCLICKKAPKEGLVVDHRHLDGAFRGLVCGLCNRGLGFFLDSPELLEAAAAYVRRTNVVTTRAEQGNEATSLPSS